MHDADDEISGGSSMLLADDAEVSPLAMASPPILTASAESASAIRHDDERLLDFLGGAMPPVSW